MEFSAHGHISALQKDLGEIKGGKGGFKEHVSRDLIAHEGFDRVFERRNQNDFPDYTDASNINRINVREQAHKLLRDKGLSSNKVKGSGKLKLLFTHL